MAENPHFRSFENLEDADTYVEFESLGHRIENPAAIRIHVPDRRLREVAPTLELFYEQYVLSQSRRGAEEAWHASSEETYGGERREAWVGSHIAFAYELGEEPDPDDIDPRQAAVVTWSDGDLFCFLASDVLELSRLLEVANSLYEQPSKD